MYLDSERQRDICKHGLALLEQLVHAWLSRGTTPCWQQVCKTTPFTGRALNDQENANVTQSRFSRIGSWTKVDHFSNLCTPLDQRSITQSN